MVEGITVECSSKIPAIVGSRGFGKSKLVMLIIGDKKPLSGSIILFGHQSVLNNVLKSLDTKQGGMSQDDSIPTHLRGGELLNFSADLNKRSSSDIKNRIRIVLFQLDLYDERRKYMCKLSGGANRCFSLAVSIAHRPGLEVLDRTTVRGESVLQYKMY